MPRVPSKPSLRTAGLRRLATFSLALAAAALLAACAPRLAPPGPAPTPPAIAGDRLITADGLALPLRSWCPPAGVRLRAVVLALHGFNDYSEAFEEPGRFWARWGVATYAYDQRGFGAAPDRGLWPGRDTLVGDLRSAARLLHRRYPGTPLYLLGDSMGGAVVLDAMTRPDPPRAAGAILVAPAVWGRDTMPLIARVALWLGSHLIPWHTVTGQGLGIQASDNIAMLRALGRDPLVIKETRIDTIHGLVDLMDAGLAAAPRFTAPALLLYGEKDEVVPPAPILRFWRALPAPARDGQHLAVYPDGWHMLLRDLEAETVRRDVLDWIDDPAAPLPSGAETRALQRLAAESG